MGVQVSGATTGDLDDDEGGGLVGKLCLLFGSTCLITLYNWGLFKHSLYEC